MKVKQHTLAFGHIVRTTLKVLLTLIVMITSVFQFGQPAAAIAQAPTPPPASAGAAVPRKRGPHIMPFNAQGSPKRPLIAPPGAHLTYYDGPVLTSIKSYDVSYGTGTFISSGTPATWIPAFTGQLLGSGLMDWLNEYNTNLTGGTNQLIGRGSYGGSITITPSSANNGNSINDSQIQAELISQILAGHLPAPDANTSYALFFRLGQSICQGGSCSLVSGGFCAYHSTFSINNVVATYQVMPDLTGTTGCGNSTALNNTTMVLSHELIETVTDPQVGFATTIAPPLAWYDIQNGEIADICNAQSGTFVGTDANTYTTELEFSNVSNNCILTRDFTISASPNSLTLPQGGSGGSTINTTAVGNSGTLSLSVSGVPTGMTATLTPTSLTSGVSSNLSLSASSTLAPGVYTLTVTGTQVTTTHSVNITVTVPSAAALSLTKTDNLNPGQYSSVGQVVGFTLTATNTGDVSLTNVNVSDSPALDSYSCASGTSLAPGSSITCTGTHTITQADLDAGSFSDTASATSDQASAPNATDIIHAASPDFSISATPASLTAVAGGASVVETISTAVSAGSSSTITLSTSGLPAGVSAILTPSTVTAGGTATLTISAAPSATPGTYTIVVTGTSISAQHSTSFQLVILAPPALSLTKTDNLNPVLYTRAGQVVTFTLTATNTGGVPLTNVSVNDAPALDNYTCTPSVPAGSLAPGAMVVCTGTHAITQADLDAGTYRDVASASSDQVSAPNATDTLHAAPRLIVVKHVVNNYGGTHVAGDFTIKVTGVTPSITSFPGAEAPGTTLTLGAGAYSVSEVNLYGYTQASAVGCSGTIAVGQTITCTITNNDLPGTLVIKKITDPVNTGSFAFTTTGAGLSGFNLAGGGQTSQTLSAGTYTVTESTQLGWVLTGIGQDPVNPSAPMACGVTGTGGSSGTGNLSTQTATITLKNGDTVTCVFENTGQGVTRTQGFWATHTPLASIAWFGGTAFGHTFPGVANTAGINDITLCGRPIDSIGKLEGAFWSSISSTSTGAKRSQLDQQRMQLLQQMLAAELNASAFGSLPAGGSTMFAAWESAYCGTSQPAIKTAFTQSSTFDTTGDSALFTPGTSADSKNARAIANLTFWDVLP